CGASKLAATSNPGNLSDTATVTVSGCTVPVASVSVTPASATVAAGQSVQLTATPKDANGAPLSGRTVTWSSNNTSVAIADVNGNVTAVAPGSATITAESEGQSGTAAITVTNVPVVSVTVTPASASIQQGQTIQLTATPKDANGNALSGRVVTWSSSNTAVASVDVSGIVTGVAAGSATITATSEGQSGTAAITVTSVPVASVTVSPASASVQAGQTVQLTATPKDVNGNPLTGRTITWSSSNTSVATVNSSGLVSGVVAGSATITATSEGQSGTSAITVTGAAPGCAASTTAFQNSAFTSQNGSFTATFDATPTGTGLDAATGLSQGAAAAYTDLAVIVRFNTGGTIDARNGGAYAATNSIGYTAGTSYHFRVVVDVSSHTYSAYVTPAGGAEQQPGGRGRGAERGRDGRDGGVGHDHGHERGEERHLGQHGGAHARRLGDGDAGVRNRTGGEQPTAHGHAQGRERQSAGGPDRDLAEQQHVGRDGQRQRARERRSRGLGDHHGDE